MDELTEIREEAELPEEVETLLTQLATLKEKRKRASMIWSAFVPGSLMVGLIVSMALRKPHPLFGSLVISVFIAVTYDAYSWLRMKKEANSIKKEDVKCLFTSKDERAQSVLFHIALGSHHPEWSPGEQEYLQNWLLQLTPQNSRFLTPDQKICLFRAIDPKGKGLTFLVLKVLENLGDVHTVPSLEHWKTNHVFATVNPQVTEAIQHCIAAIEQRIAQENVTAQLLRPSSATEAPDTLLRPVTHRPDENAETLLRADLTPRSQGAQQFENRAQQATPLRTPASLYSSPVYWDRSVSKFSVSN